MTHHCHAHNCKTPVPPEMLMCKRHWFMVPKRHRDAVLRHYRPGQCDDRSPSAAWHEAADLAIASVAEKEGHDMAATYYRQSAAEWRDRQ